jgi:uncharacterized membrane protein
MRTEEWLVALTETVVPLIETMALIVIVVGTVEAFFVGLSTMLRQRGDHHAMRAVWQRYARWLIAGLTFQLAADIIGTSIAPNWDQIGQLAAIAVIRTFLNFFLERDQREMRELQKEPLP